MNQLVRDLLLFARPPRPNPTPVDLAELLSKTALLVGEDVAHRDVQVVISGNCPAILADAELLKIVFLNLFLNSAHAMRHTGAITVSLTAVDSSCRIAVSDTGPGISPEVRAKLFTPFVTTKSRGTGLGLSTVKRLVEAHGGEIDVDCPPNGGTTVEGSCRITVADTGPGIPPEVRAKLFTPFVTTKSRGTGLGLSTVKRLVEAHGGQIHVDCPPGGGTSVAITLPLATT